MRWPGGKVARFASTKLRTARADLLETFLKFREVRSCPIDLAAAGAMPELFVINFREWLESFDYFSLGDLLQRRVATKTSRKWSDGAEQVEAANYFDGLFVSVLRARAVTGRYYRVHEQPPVACKECSSFAFHY